MNDESQARTSDNFVRDKRADVGLKINNVLTALVLAVISWVGFNIDDLRKEFATLRGDVNFNAKSLEKIDAEIKILRQQYWTIREQRLQEQQRRNN